MPALQGGRTSGLRARRIAGPLRESYPSTGDKTKAPTGAFVIGRVDGSGWRYIEPL